MAEKYGLDLMLLHKRNGWQLWHRKGITNEPICVTEEDYGDGYTFMSRMDAEEFYEGEVAPMLDAFSTLDELQDFVENMRDIYEEVSNLADDERAVIHDGELLEIICTEVTSWEYDTHGYAIALMDLD